MRSAPETDKRSRTIRVYDLPEGTQEGLLQQALEKLAPVKRLEMFAKSHEAMVELTNAAVSACPAKLTEGHRQATSTPRTLHL
jgi:hypothetical protein